MTLMAIFNLNDSMILQKEAPVLHLHLLAHEAQRKKISTPLSVTSSNKANSPSVA